MPSQHVLGQVDLWTYVSQAGGKTNVCVRAEAGTTVAGGRLEIEPSGSLGVAPVVDATQTDVSLAFCPQQIHESGSIDRVYTSAPGSNPFRICVTVLGTSRRIDVGTATVPSSPFVRWVPDTGSVIPAQQIP